MDNKDFQKLVEKIKKLKAGGSLDLSLEEDLSIGIMNLVSLEEHFYFTAEKTGKTGYFDLMSEVREVRKSLLGRMIDRKEGETWCISKHLLAATMRLIEVGTKYRSDGKAEDAKTVFDQAYKLYSMFWGLRLKLVDAASIKAVGHNQLNKHDAGSKQPWKVEDIVDKLVDCCNE
ncbi:MAG: hypothetical protein M1275_02580 [Patescibacteria group bacterium]|nr:hypothetical protein [Patescibacteria group bacterium]